MKKILLALMIIIFLAGVSAMVFIMKPLFQSRSPVPYARNGVLDLTGWDFERHDFFRLDGEWEFYRGRLVKPGEFSQMKPPEYIKVPSAWETTRLGKKKPSPFGCATYRLLIKTGLKEVNRDFGIKTSLIRLSNSIFINGVLLESSGKPAWRIRDYIPGNRPYVVYFKPEHNRIELVVHAANFDYASGAGIFGPVYFGKKAALDSFREKALMYDWIMITGFLLMGIILICYFFQLGKYIALLYLGLNCFARGIYALTHGEKTIYWVLPWLNFHVLGKIQYLSVTAFGAFLVLYMYYTFRNIANKSVVRIFTGAGIVLALLGLLLPLKIQSRLDPLQAVYGLSAMSYTVYLLIRGILYKQEEAGYLIVAVLSMMVYAMISCLNVIGKVDISLLPPFEPLVFILSQAFLHTMRFSAAFRKVEELSENLAAVDRIKDEFLAKTSHEFRAPLAQIVDLSQATLENENHGKLAGTHDDNLKLITAIAKRLARLVNDIQDLVKIQNRGLKIRPAPLDIKPIIQVILGFFRYTATGKDITLVENIPDNLPLVLVDEDRIKQIIHNLLDNIIKLGGAGGVAIRAIAETGSVKIWIEEPGLAISDEIIKDFFIPYHQISATNQGKPSGGRLDLAIAKELVELHQGKIWVENMRPGARICLTLPAVAGTMTDDYQGHDFRPVLNEEPVEIETPYEIHTDGEYTILAADDDPVNLQILINTFIAENYNIIAVKNGIEALEQLEKIKDIDILVLDLMMPGVSGYEVCKKVRGKFSLSELPVLILTAADQTMDMTASFEAGANDFLAKPYDLSQLKFKTDLPPNNP